MWWFKYDISLIKQIFICGYFINIELVWILSIWFYSCFLYIVIFLPHRQCDRREYSTFWIKNHLMNGTFNYQELWKVQLLKTSNDILRKTSNEFFLMTTYLTFLKHIIFTEFNDNFLECRDFLRNSISNVPRHIISLQINWIY